MSVRQWGGWGCMCDKILPDFPPPTPDARKCGGSGESVMVKWKIHLTKRV